MNGIKFFNAMLLVLLIASMGAGQALASGPITPVSIGALPAGKSVTITFNVTVNNPFPSGPTQVCNQGNVTADGGVNVLTDDPSIGGSADPTCTMVTRPDIGVIAINAPSSDCGLGMESVTITISNFTAFALSGFNVQYQVTGPINTGPITETFTGTLPASGTAMFTFSGAANLSTEGVYAITATTLLTDDPNTGNNSANASVENEGSCITPFVFLANKITLEETKQNTPGGNMHSNGTLFIEKGEPSTYNSNLTAKGKITVEKHNTINGSAKSQTSISNSGTITGGTSIGPVATVPLPSLTYTAGGQNKTVPSGGSLVLAPGSYGIVTLSNNGTLKLTSGEYFMNELRYSSSIEGGKIEINLAGGNPVVINVVTNLQLGHEAEIRLLPNGQSDSPLVTFNTKQTANANWGREAYLLGSFNAPNAKVTLVKNTQLRGSISAKEIFVSNDCLFLHHLSPGSLPGPGNLPKTIPLAGEVEEISSEPVTSYVLEQNYPNPFNPTTMITFALPEAGEVSLAIYNMGGQLVRKLVYGEYASGKYEVMWDATDDRGARVASGVYLYILRAGEFTTQKKLVLMK